MKLMLLTLLLGLASCNAYEPPRHFDPYPNGIQRATHIFVANASRVSVVSSRTGQVLRPEPDWLQYGQLFEVEIDEVEALYPATWHPPKRIMVFIDGYTSEFFRRALVGTKQVYLLRRTREGYFTHPGSQFLQPLDKQSEILDIRSRMEHTAKDAPQ
jgi:hypothetical protein